MTGGYRQHCVYTHQLWTWLIDWAYGASEQFICNVHLLRWQGGPEGPSILPGVVDDHMLPSQKIFTGGLLVNVTL